MDCRKVQLIRVAGDTLKTQLTAEEKRFRETEYPSKISSPRTNSTSNSFHLSKFFSSDENKVLKKDLKCTSCGKDMKDRIISQFKINIHPVLEVLWCKVRTQLGTFHQKHIT